MGRLKVLFLFTIFVLASISQTVSADTELQKFAQKIDGLIEWDPLGNGGVLISGKSRILFSPDSQIILLNYTEKLPGTVYRGEKGGVYFSRQAEDSILSSIAYNPDTKNPSIAAILIDPGHGGKDTGAIGEHMVDGKKLIVKEKDVVLKVSRRLYSMLTEKYPGKSVMLTRNDDSYPSLEDRVDMANNVKLSQHDAIIYVSIHANASLNKSAKGFEVWYLPPDYRRTLIDQDSLGSNEQEIAPILNTMLEEEYTTESILLAQRILNNMNDKIGKVSPNRGLKEEIWFVVRKAKMPSVLIELGFVTNKDEAVLLTDKAYLKKLSEAIYNGIVSFVDDFEKTKGFTE